MARTWSARRRTAVAATTVLLLPVWWAVGPIDPADAVTFTVDDTADANDATPDGVCATAGGSCTLRAAVQEANALPEASTVTVPAGTYGLSLGELLITNTFGVTISGSGQLLTTLTPGIRGGGDIVRVDNNAVAALADLGATGVDGGSAIRVLSGGSLDANRIEVYGNQASESIPGIRNEGGTVTLTRSIVRDNLAEDGAAPVLNDSGGLMTITDTTFSGNTGSDGGALRASNGAQTVIVNAVFSGNTATCCAGAIYNTGQSTMTVAGSEVTGNTAVDLCGCGLGGGGIFNENGAVLTVSQSLIEGNEAPLGGGILDLFGQTLIDQSTISGNTASGTGVGGPAGGGGIVSAGAVDIVNSTISGNTSANVGGGIIAAGSTTLQNSTVAFNTTPGAGGGIFSAFFPDPTLTNSIVSDNSPDACNGAGVISNDHNLVDDLSCALGGPNDIEGQSPGLAALALNGGPTPTHAITMASPAAVAGNDAACAAAPVNGVDQRGEARTPPCAIGAFEPSAAPPPPPGGGGGGGGDSDALPRVSVTAVIGTATEGGAPGQLRFTRTHNPSSALRVVYGVAGTAASGDDFTPLGTVTFPAGQSSVDVPITALSDGLAESDETVVVTVLADTAYLVGEPKNATVTIADRAQLLGATGQDRDGDGELGEGDGASLQFDRPVAAESSLTLADEDGDVVVLSDDDPLPTDATAARFVRTAGGVLRVIVDGPVVVTGDGDGSLAGGIRIVACAGIGTDVDGDGRLEPGEGEVECGQDVVLDFPPPFDVCGAAPEDGFVDVPEDNVHEAAIDCVAGSGVVVGGPLGRRADEFGPALHTRRGQLASMILRVLAASGVEVPSAAADAFDDDEGSPHERAINRLAELGLSPGSEGRSFFPTENVDRDVMAAFVNGAFAIITGEPLRSDVDQFTDDEDSAYEDDINGLAAAGIILGRTSTTFEPGESIRRDQLASFFARLFQVLHDEGFPVGVG